VLQELKSPPFSNSTIQCLHDGEGSLRCFAEKQEG
jgi:hypothetical protein